MRSIRTRVALVAAAALVVVSCDTRLAPAVRRGDPPSIDFLVPAADTSKVNIGDSVLVHVDIEGGTPFQTLTIRGDAQRGNKDLGTFVEVPRYTPIVLNFPGTTTDTTIRRYLQPSDASTELDTIAFTAVILDSAGRADTTRRVALIVSGPRITLEEPGAGQSIAAGTNLSITARATDPDNVRSITIVVTGGVRDSSTQTFSGGSITEQATRSVPIPAGLTPGTALQISVSADDFQGQTGALPAVTVTIRENVPSAPPLVTQVVPTLSEVTEPIMVTASGQNINVIGVIVREAGVELARYADTLTVPAFNVRRPVRLRLPLAHIGKRVTLTAYAEAGSGPTAITGFAVRSATSAPVADITLAISDPTEIVHGITYDLPLPGTIADLVVDEPRSRVYMSNTVHNRLEMWTNSTKSFHTPGIAVGSLPWGLFMSPDSVSPGRTNLLVANSGGTNISQVNIGLTVPSEDLPNRILTRNVYVHQLVEARDASTGRIVAAVSPIIGYSDRPQHIGQTETGRIYISTRPTSFAPEGTIRYLEPRSTALPFPDPRIIWQYVDAADGTEFRWTIFNVDSVFVESAGPSSPLSDRIVVYDHPYGQATGTICVNGPGCVQSTNEFGFVDNSMIAVHRTLRALQSDAEIVLRLDLAQVPLKDTTFVAASGNAKWIAFGEGNSAPAANGARVIMVADSFVTPSGRVKLSSPVFISRWQDVRDLTENAAERVFGIALDRTGATVAAHGLQSYFSRVDLPFHLRLQGKFDSPDEGAGIAMHPEADGAADPTLAPETRLGFIATATGEIEIVDLAYFISRGRLKLKHPIYGPLRVSRIMNGDNNTVVAMKLFALTQRGLIVIDVRIADIKAGPS